MPRHAAGGEAGTVERIQVLTNTFGAGDGVSAIQPGEEGIPFEVTPVGVQGIRRQSFLHTAEIQKPPDIVVGASVGALNGWAIASGCRPEELARRWLELADLRAWKMRFPWPPLGGVFDCTCFEKMVRDMYEAYRPVIPCGVVVTDVRRLKPCLVSEGVRWEHLAASCAVPVLFPQQRIERTWYSDGGLLASLPVWAAAQMGATRVLAVQVLPYMPSVVVRTFVKGVRAIAGPSGANQEVSTITLGPQKPLGSAWDMLGWKRELAQQWIDEGRAEAARNKQSLQRMFWE